MKWFIVVVFLVISVQACKMDWVMGKSTKGCVMVDGKKREFRYFIPNQAKAHTLPVLIGLHGGGGNPKRFEGYSRFSEFSEKLGTFMIIYPKGVDKHWNDGRENVNSGVDDVKFISRLIALSPYAKKGEVYVTGMSNGGLMIQKLGCEIASKLKGLAVVGATMSTNLQNKCSNTKPLDALFIFGTEDTAFLDNGHLVSPLAQKKVRGYHIGIDKTLKYWKERNRCEKATLSMTLDNYTHKWGKFKDDGTKVLVYDYHACKKKLRYYKVEGGGHRWPDKEASNGLLMRKVVGNASHEISASEEIIEFFGLAKR